MKQKGLIVSVVIIVLTIAVTLYGCQSKQKEENKNISETSEEGLYRSSFTEEEKETGFAEFELMENVSVEAELTPTIKYKQGLAKYYMDCYYETEDLKDKKEFKKNPTLYRKQLSKILNILSKEFHGKFDQEMVWSLGERTVSVKTYLQGKNGYKYDFHTFWYTGHEAFDNKEQLYTPNMRLELQEGINSCIDDDIASAIKRYVWDFAKEEILSFEDKKKMGEELKQYMEGILDRKLCDTWECIPVSENTITDLKKTAKQAGVDLYDSYKAPEEEYYEYQFYYDIEGLPFVWMGLPYNLKEGETCSLMASVSVLAGAKQLSGLGANPQKVCLSKNGILRLYTDKDYLEGEIYKEATKVIDPDKILEQVKGYYERQIIITPVKITNIRLMYSGYFTDAEDGMIEPAVCPFWVVTAYAGSAGGYAELVYDAFTGESIK